MLKRDITYEDFDGQTLTETYYFNLTKSEIIDLELSVDGGLEASLTAIVRSQDMKAIIREFKRIILTAYGVRSDDGKRFIKNDKVREEFSQTAAYDALFMDLATNEDAAANFIRGVLPAGMSQEISAVDTPPLPPTN